LDVWDEVHFHPKEGWVAMADFVFNIAKGRVGEFYNRVKGNDPANSAFIIVALKSAGLEADDTLNNYDDLSTLLAAANDEATNTGYARKTLTDADLVAFPAPDDTGNLFNFDIPDQTWTAVQVTGGAWGKLLVCYDNDTTSGTDSNIIPMTAHDFAVTPDGTDIVAVVAAAGFFRAA
jgi:hypothetical protein